MNGLRGLVGSLALLCLGQSVRAESPKQRVTVVVSTCGDSARLPPGGHLIVSDGLETLVKAKLAGGSRQVTLPTPATLFVRFEAPQIESTFQRFQTPTNGPVRVCVRVVPLAKKSLQLSARRPLVDQLKEGESFIIEYHLESCWNVETMELRIGKMNDALVAWLSVGSRQRGACVPHPKILSAPDQRRLREFLELVARPADESQKIGSDSRDSLRVRFRGLQSQSLGLVGSADSALWAMYAWFSCTDG